MPAFRSLVIWGENPETLRPNQLPIILESSVEVGDGTAYIMGVEPFSAVDPNWGWNKLLEHLEIIIPSLELSTGTLDDSQLPLSLTFNQEDFAQPYTPVTPGPNFFDFNFLDLTAEQSFIAEETGVVNQYLGMVEQDLGDGPQDVLFYCRIDRIYSPLRKWWYQHPVEGKFYSETLVTYYASFWLEADIEEGDYFVLGVSPSDGTSHVFPLGSNPSLSEPLKFIYQLSASSIQDGHSEFGEITMPGGVPPIKIYDFIVDPPQSEVVATWAFEKCVMGLQRWGPRDDIP